MRNQADKIRDINSPGWDGVNSNVETLRVSNRDQELGLDISFKKTFETKDGKKAVGTIKSSIEGEKLGASVLFIDLGITDAITDKHRTYPSSFVIPVK